MDIEFDANKGFLNFMLRGVSFNDFPRLFENRLFVSRDARTYGDEVRYVVFGTLQGRLVFAAFTMRGDVYRVISMRKANERECKNYEVIH